MAISRWLDKMALHWLKRCGCTIERRNPCIAHVQRRTRQWWMRRVWRETINGSEPSKQ